MRDFLTHKRFLKGLTHGRGFTLIELIVAVAIIGVLVAVIVVNLNTSRVKARNAQRISDLQKIQLALEEYFDDNKKYPTCNGNNLCSSLDGDGSFGPLRELEIKSGYLRTIPLDPVNKSVSGIIYNYCYIRGYRKLTETTVLNTGSETDYILVARLEDASYSGYGAPIGTSFTACGKPYRNILLGN